MAEIKIVTEEEKDKKPADETDLRKTLIEADKYEKIKQENDALELELQRQQELKAKLQMGGESMGGTVQKTQKDRDKDEADRIIGMFR